MLRKARKDAPSDLHHVIFGGIERKAIFHTEEDRSDILNAEENRQMRIYFMILLVGMALVGCSGMPSRPDVVLGKSSRVGVLVEIGTHPHQTHIGATVFDTFRKVYPFSWELKQLSKKVFIDKIEHAGFEAVDLEPMGYTYESIYGLVVRNGATWEFNPKRIETVKQLMDEQHLEAILLVKETAVAAEWKGMAGVGGADYISVEGSGLYSKLTLDGVKYKAIAGVRVKLLSLNPPADLSFYTPLQRVADQLYIRSVDLDNSLYPADRKNATQEEFEKILPKVLTCMGGLADTAVCAVTAADKAKCYNSVLDGIQKAGSSAGK
jgi:hypothetical protein